MIAPSHFNVSDDLDAKLMLRLKNGELDVFDSLVRRNRSTVFRYIQHLQAPRVADRDDLSQQVFLRVYKSRHTYQVTARFSSWLYIITRNVVLNVNRQLARRREVSLQQSLSSDPQSPVYLEISENRDPALALIRTESRLAVRRAMTRLGPRQQMALRLIHFQGYSYLAAAKELMLSEMALKSLVQRARMGLKKNLQDEHGEGIDDMLKAGVSHIRKTYTLKRR